MNWELSEAERTWKKKKKLKGGFRWDKKETRELEKKVGNVFRGCHATKAKEKRISFLCFYFFLCLFFSCPILMNIVFFFKTWSLIVWLLLLLIWYHPVSFWGITISLSIYSFSICFQARVSCKIAGGYLINDLLYLFIFFVKLLFSYLLFSKNPNTLYFFKEIHKNFGKKKKLHKLSITCCYWLLASLHVIKVNWTIKVDTAIFK